MILFPQIYRCGEPLCHVDGIEPLLASWDHREHPSQIRLRSYLRELRSNVGELPADRTLSLEYGVALFNTPELGLTLETNRRCFVSDSRVQRHQSLRSK